MRIACSGTIIALTMTRNTAVDMRKRNFENAKPAGSPTQRMMKIDAEQRIVELSTSWPTGMTLVKLDQLSHEKPPPERNCDSDFKLVMTITQNGYSMMIATTTIAPKRVQRPTFRGFFIARGSLVLSDSAGGVTSGDRKSTRL